MLYNSIKFYYEKDKSYKESLIVRLNTSLADIERRIHYRMRSKIQIELSLQDDRRFFDAVTEDLSCGGVRLSCNCDIAQFSILTLHFNINEGYYCITGKVIHKRYSKEDDYIYTYGVEFADIGIDEQQAISQYILEEHRRIIKGKRKIKEPLMF